MIQLEVPTLSTARECADWCLQTYRDGEVQIKRDKEARFCICEAEGLHGAKLYDAAVTIFQGKDKGGLAHRIIFQGYQSFFGNVTSGRVEQRTDPYSSKRDSDCFWVFPSAILSASVTTKPQERKDDTWPGEAARLWNHRNEWKPRTVFFAGIFFDGGQQVRQAKQDFLSTPNSRIIAVQDIEDHARALQNILSAGLA